MLNDKVEKKISSDEELKEVSTSSVLNSVHTPEEIIKAYGQIEESDQMLTDEQTYSLAIDSLASSKYTEPGSAYSNKFLSRYKKSFEENGKVIETRVRTPKGNIDSDSSNADNLANFLLNLSVPITGSLANSGFTITLKAIDPDDRMVLAERLYKDAEDLFVSTLGYIVSSDNYRVHETLFEFVESNIAVKTLEMDGERGLGDYVDIRDLRHLEAMLLANISPDGIYVSIPCDNLISDDESEPIKCSNLIQGYVNIDSITYHDFEEMTSDMREVLLRRGKNSVKSLTINGKSEPDDIDKYIQDLNEIYTADGKNVLEYTLKSGSKNIDIKIILKGFISVNEYFTASRKRHAHFEDLIDKALLADDEDSKASAIIRAMEENKLTSYAHAIEAIIINGSKITNSKAIFTNLQRLTTILLKLDNAPDIMGDIQKYLGDTTLTTIGISTIECSECKQEIKGADKKHKDIRPLNILETFFFLRGQQLI